MSEMREAILREATQLFADHGFEGTSLNDIAAGVGIRRPSLLHHFSSKDALYGEVFETMLSHWFDKLDSAVLQPGDGWQKFSSVVVAGFDHFAENPAYVRLMRREALDGGQRLAIDLTAVVKPYFDSAVSWLEQEMGRGTFRRHDARQVVVSAYGALLSYFSDSSFLNGLFPDSLSEATLLAERRDHVLSFLQCALVADSEEPRTTLV